MELVVMQFFFCDKRDLAILYRMFCRSGTYKLIVLINLEENQL